MSEQRKTTTPIPHWRVLAIVTVLVVLFAGCSNDSESSGDDSTSEPASDESAVFDAEAPTDRVESEGLDSVAAEEAEPASDGSIGGGGVSDTAALQPVDIGRDIIFTATIDVEVDDIVVASQEALDAVQGVGGLLFGQNTTTEGVPRTVLTFKVPPGEFQRALSRLGEIGFVRDQRISADDVTERVVDLESRIITAQASVERLRGFLEGATTLTDIAELERQLLDRETNLELLRGQLRTVQDQVDLATITLTMSQRVPGPELTLEATVYAARSGDFTCPGEEELEVDEGDEVTVCYRLTNTGDTLLGNIFVRDESLDLDIDDLEVVSGSLDEPLAVGASVVLAATFEAEAFTTVRAVATAEPVDEDGNDLRLGATTARGDADLRVLEDTSLPGFLDGMEAGVGVLAGVLAVIVLSAGFALPFIWLVPAVWFGLRWRRKRAAAKEERARAELDAIPPPVSTPAAPERPQSPADKVDPPVPT